MTTLIVTRPAREAQAWVQALQAAGQQAHALPLIEVGDSPQPERLAHCRSHLDRFDALMFVSAQAVDRFWAAPGSPANVAEGPRCWAPGPGTARALLLAGVPAARIDAPAEDAPQFDSEALWARVQGQVRPGHRLLIVHGVSADGHAGRDWLARQCEAAGGEVERCVAYRRQVPSVWPGLPAAASPSMRWSAPPVWWLFSSSEAVANLAQLEPAVDWSAAQALATHPRIAAAAQALGFGRVLQTRPALPDVLQTLESLNRS